MRLSKTYDHKLVEDKIYALWEKSGCFNPDACVKKGVCKKNAAYFSIVLPPPNVTGTLHMGHAAMLAVEDILVRYHRMRGKKTLWLPGTDHAAIATESRVEQELYKREGKTRHDLGREKFLKLVETFAKESHDTIVHQIKKMGSSLDWSREAYTLDEKRSLAVRTAFKLMWDAGLIYRGEYIVNWDPKMQTTVSDDEIEWKEEKAPFYYLKYGPFVIGTARPETKFGDKYVVMHPKDKRYEKYRDGQKIEVEWINGKITATVVKDSSIDMEFGTGVMTITPFHDRADFEIAERHSLDKEQIIDLKGKLLPIAQDFASIHISKARPFIVEKLQKKGLVERIDGNYVHRITINSRGGGVIEPQIMRQWFINVSTLKQNMIDVVKKGKIKIVPKRFEKIYFHWINNLRDWCISRQIWFGHRIPVWYCGDPNMKRMGFAGDIVRQVFDGKISTWRVRDHGFYVGDIVALQDSSTKKIFGYGKIIHVQKTTIGEIDLKDTSHYKTYGSREELIAAFKRHNPDKKLNKNSSIWAYTYEFNANIKKGACGMIIVAQEAPSACPTCNNRELTQDPDTLDTWFSSGLWTFSTLGWPSKTKDLEDYHPTSVLETGYDILFFWVARMILMSTCLLGEIPFKTVYLHGLVRDEKGRKMSKSLGNVIDPLTMVEKYGADATRLSLIIGAAPGNDMKLSEDRVRGYRNFANKIWNIARFVLLNLEGYSPGKRISLSVDEEKILKDFEKVKKEATKLIEEFRLSQAAEQLYRYLWHTFADKILEESKVILQNPKRKTARQYVLLSVLKDILKMLHPFIPFVTEEIYQQLPLKDKKETLMIEKWPFDPTQGKPL